MLYTVKPHAVYWLLGKMTTDDTAMLKSLAAQMRDRGKPWTLIISSPGGTFDTELFKELRLSIFTAHVAFYAAGSAALVALCAAKRTVEPFTQLVLTRPYVDSTIIPNEGELGLVRRNINYIWALLLNQWLAQYCRAVGHCEVYNLEDAAGEITIRYGTAFHSDVATVEELESEEELIGPEEYLADSIVEMHGGMFDLDDKSRAVFDETMDSARQTYCTLNGE